MKNRLIVSGKILILGFFVFMAGWLSPPQIGLAEDTSANAYVGTETCLMCHDELGEDFQHTSHGVLIGRLDKYKDRLCEACHGPGSAHAEDGDAGLIINPAQLTKLGEQDPCLACHGDSKYYKWEFSAHATSDMHCADCHSSHAAAGGHLKKDMPDLCYDCHSNVMADFYMPSHHPLQEGVVGCLDCHDIHGGDMKFAFGDDSRQRCFACHPQIEGPFIFEHAPVNEDCSICHAPHGSVANNLLTQGEPALCLNCHQMHFHAIIPGIDTLNMESPQMPGRYLNSTEDAFKYGMLTKCSQCHTSIHGSDLPAQSISGQGTSLTR